MSSNCRIGEDLYSNAFERIQRGILDQIVQPDFTVLDIGANLGFYTCLFAKRVGATGRVIAVEPTPTVFRALKRNVALNGLGDTVNSICVALSDEKGTARMNVFADGKEVYNSLGSTSSPKREIPEGGIEVRTTTLDALLNKVPPNSRCFAKIDVEGYQHQVLMGGIQQLSRLKNIALMVEMNEWASQQCGFSTRNSIELLHSCGFNSFVTNDGKSLLRLCDSRDPRKPLNEDVFFLKNRTSLVRAA